MWCCGLKNSKLGRSLEPTHSSSRISAALQRDSWSVPIALQDFRTVVPICLLIDMIPSMFITLLQLPPSHSLFVRQDVSLCLLLRIFVGTHGLREIHAGENRYDTKKQHCGLHEPLTPLEVRWHQSASRCSSLISVCSGVWLFIFATSRGKIKAMVDHAEHRF